jgi:hypothetical protein
MNYTVKFRQDFSKNWNIFNPVLRPGEIAVDINLMQFKIGDGKTPWKELNYCGDAAVFNGARLYTLNNDCVTFITNIEKKAQAF